MAVTPRQSPAELEVVLTEYIAGNWQSERKIRLRQIGMSRTILEPDHEYKCLKQEPVLGPDRKFTLRTILESPRQKVHFQYKYDESGLSQVELFELARKEGAIAFVAREPFSSPELDGRIHDIPFYLPLEPDVPYISDHGFRLQPCSDPGHLFAGWANPRDPSRNVSAPVVQALISQGVRNEKDAAYMLLDYKEKELEDKLATEAKLLVTEAKMLAQKAENETHRILFPSNFTLQDIGVGGLGKDFEVVFRRLFTSRMFSPGKLGMLGISHVRGLLLVGPPGCGKTLLARQLNKLLKTTKTTVISGPEVLSKWFGESEENVRNLFADAEAEWKEKGERSGLHVIIIDEIDAICGKRTESSSAGGRAMNSIVNQLLSKIDGVHSINNVLLIGTTNRKDVIDPALLRPGRFELHLKIDLPDQAGRLEILNIHTKAMRQGGLLDDNTVDSLATIAGDLTEGFSGAELESVVKGACSLAMDRCIDPTDYSLPPDESKLKLELSDFLSAVEIVKKTKTDDSK